MRRSGSMSRPRGAGCPTSSPGARRSRFALRSSSSAKGHGKRSARPKRTGFGQFDTQVWGCPRSPSRCDLSRLLARSYALRRGHGRSPLREDALVPLLLVVQSDVPHTPYNRADAPAARGGECSLALAVLQVAPEFLDRADLPPRAASSSSTSTARSMTSDPTSGAGPAIVASWWPGSD
jgi:hypothetical protein